jgi:hypothetical protein
VNEPAADQITELLNDDLQLTESEDNLDGTDDADEELPAARPKEGLPSTFRMRHDAHYVDELMSRSPDAAPDRRETRAPAAAFHTPSPAAALPLIADRLESIAAHSGIVRAQQSTTSLIAQSIEVEFARVTRLARAAAVLQNREAPMLSEVSGREIVDTALRAGAPVARLAGVELDASVDDPAFAILAEPAMVLQGVAGSIDAVVDLLLADTRRRPAADARHPAARISISLQTVKVRPAIILDMFCPTLIVTSAQAERFFENAAEDYRGAPAAGVLLAAAAQIVRAHGGRADVKRHNAAGATITYVFPQSP